MEQEQETRWEFGKVLGRNVSKPLATARASGSKKEEKCGQMGLQEWDQSRRTFDDGLFFFCRGFFFGGRGDLRFTSRCFVVQHFVCRVANTA
jgi:hypothetical protein